MSAEKYAVAFTGWRGGTRPLPGSAGFYRDPMIVPYPTDYRIIAGPFLGRVKAGVALLAYLGQHETPDYVRGLLPNHANEVTP